jgi:hypothetical protein
MSVPGMKRLVLSFTLHKSQVFAHVCPHSYNWNYSLKAYRSDVTWVRNLKAVCHFYSKGHILIDKPVQSLNFKVLLSITQLIFLEFTKF